MIFKEFEILNTKGIKIHFDFFENDKDTPTIIFFHGTSGYTCPNNPYHRAFGPFEEALAEKFNVLGATIEGHGKSEGKRGHFTILSYVEVGKIGLDWLEKNGFVNKFGVTGWSMGGIGALYLTAADERIKSAFIHNPAVCDDPEIYQLSSRPWLLKNLVAPLLKFLDIFWPNFKIPISLYLNLKNIFITDEAIELWRKDPMAVKKYTIHAVLSLIRTPLPNNKTLKDIRTPICIFQPENDKVTLPWYTKKIYEKLGSSVKNYILIHGENANHSLIRYAPELVAHFATDWFVKTLK
jgi:alpha-beta hydrolase superfamily lysophospholipase